MNEFSVWLRNKYVEWRGSQVGREGTISAYARWVGVPQPTMSVWLSGSKIPESNKSIKKLVDRYGREVYEILYAGDN